MAKLLVHESGGETREVELVDPEVHIGRELDNTLRLPDPSISRHHCVVRRTPTGFEIQDLQSSNGVLVNGTRVQSSPLRNGDRITLGQIQLSFQHPEDEGATVAIKAGTVPDSPVGTVRMSAEEMAAIHGGGDAGRGTDPVKMPEGSPMSTAPMVATPSAPAIPPVAPAPPAMAPPVMPPPPASAVAPSSSGGAQPYSDDDKIFLFLAYFGLLSLVPFIMFKDKQADPQKEYIYWHARQGLALAISVFCLCILMIIPILGCLFMILVPVIALGGSILGWIKAFGGEKWSMPLVSKFSSMLG